MTTDTLKTRLRQLPSLAGPFIPMEMDDMPRAPQAAFECWLNDAIRQGVQEPHAMTLSTVDADGIPDARVLILKNVDHRGWHFAIKAESSKNVFTISSRRDSGVAGGDARRNTAAIAPLLRGFATTQTARKTTVPPGWSEIGRFLCDDPCLHPGASCGPALRTHPDCTPTRLRRDRKHVLREGNWQPIRRRR